MSDTKSVLVGINGFWRKAGLTECSGSSKKVHLRKGGPWVLRSGQATARSGAVVIVFPGAECFANSGSVIIKYEGAIVHARDGATVLSLVLFDS